MAPNSEAQGEMATILRHKAKCKAEYKANSVLLTNHPPMVQRYRARFLGICSTYVQLLQTSVLGQTPSSAKNRHDRSLVPSYSSVAERGEKRLKGLERETAVFVW